MQRLPQKCFDASHFYCTFFVLVCLLRADECTEDIMKMFHRIVGFSTFFNRIRIFFMAFACVLCRLWWSEIYARITTENPGTFIFYCALLMFVCVIFKCSPITWDYHKKSWNIYFYCNLLVLRFHFNSSVVKQHSELSQRFHFNSNQVKQCSECSQSFHSNSSEVKQCSECSQKFYSNSSEVKQHSERSQRF